VDLGDVVGEAARGSAALHPELAVRYAFEATPRVPADPHRLRQVLSNLLANAAEAGARTVDISARTAGGQVCITLRDDGRGISPEVRDRLFEEFATGREGGTGLGLAVSRRFVELHGGSLTLLPGNGPGAVFEIRLPRG